MRKAGAVALFCVLAGSAPAAQAVPDVHAHRGGSVVEGVPTYPENTMPAFEHAATEGFVLELDVKLTHDRVPVVIHDDTLDRTTNCSGPVKAITAAELRASCLVDVLGSDGAVSAPAPAEKQVPVPTLAELLDFARDAGVRLNLEIKNFPGENDFDLTNRYARRVVDAIVTSGFPPRRLIVESYWPTNLDQVERTRALRGVQTSLLTKASQNDPAPLYASLFGYEWVSPQWPTDATTVRLAHALSRRVVPYTPNTEDQVRAARDAGVDAVITDDPVMARRVLAEG